MADIKIGKHTVGKGHPCLVMVDVGVNHNNSIERGIELIEKSAGNGADIIKFQTYKAANITTKTAPRYWNSRLDSDAGGTQYDTFSKLDGMTLEGYQAFKKRCDELGVIFSSTPFNIPDIEVLEQVGMAVYKISSSDLTYLEFITKVAETGKAVILSTGCATFGEMEKAVNAVLRTGNKQVILQHCILQYPCDPQNANLNKMVQMMQIFEGIPVGYSDHTEGIIVPSVAAALGAVTIEKHFTIDSKLPDSPDHKFAVTPEELRAMTDGIRIGEKSLGVSHSGPYVAEGQAYQLARKSIVSRVAIQKGTIIQKDMLTCKRPGTGLYPEFTPFVVGRPAGQDIPEDTVVTAAMVGCDL